jgi:hypothetical protein
MFAWFSISLNRLECLCVWVKTENCFVSDVHMFSCPNNKLKPKMFSFHFNQVKSKLLFFRLSPQDEIPTYEIHYNFVPEVRFKANESQIEIIIKSFIWKHSKLMVQKILWKIICWKCSFLVSCSNKLWVSLFFSFFSFSKKGFACSICTQEVSLWFVICQLS